MTDVLVLGAGVVGATAALELRRRGATVTLADLGPIPHPDASSTDISKLVRLDYGSDADYLSLMEDALPLWRAYADRFGETLFHETGILVLATEPMAPLGFEHDSYDALSRRGHALERLDAAAIASRFPRWAPGRFRDGYYNPRGGWAESGRVVSALLREAEREGVVVRSGVRALPIAPGPSRVAGITTETGERLAADVVVVAAGAYTPLLIPELADRLTPVAQAVFHFEIPSAASFTSPEFPPWAADIGRTGWYGFPAHAGVVKIANHGPGAVVDPRAPRLVSPDVEPRFRAFLRASLPALAPSPLVKTRLCLYCDSFDGDFFIDRHPEREGLVVASGGSGHAFKFAPVLGPIVADVVTGVAPRAEARRFRFRELGARRSEDARFVGPSR